MNELESLVARAVHPLSAFSWRKRRMHEELLLHLQLIYEEELGRAPSAEAALAATRERWGDPSVIARDLQTSVPTYERWATSPVPGLAAVDTLLWRKEDGESTARFAARFAAHVTGSTAVLGGVPAIVIGLWLDGPMAAHPPRAPFDTAMCCAIGVASLACSAFVVAAGFDRSGLRARLEPARRAPIVIKGFAITALIMALATTCLAMFTAMAVAVLPDHGARVAAVAALLRTAPVWTVSFAPLFVFVLTASGLAYEARGGSFDTNR